MSEAMVAILVALLGGSGLISGIFSIINTAISRRAMRGDKTKELEKEIAEVKKEAQENKQDVTRVQMLLLMSDYPDDIAEIMKVAEKYFREMGGNFYMDTLFNKWLDAHDLQKPSWFENH